VEKAPDAFRTISEVATDLNVPQHVLRFWESRFHEIKPMKRGGGRRYYRPDDVDLLRGIRHLLYGEGYTIRGVQRILKEQGLRFVQTVWQPGAQPPSRQPADESDFVPEEPQAEGGRGRGLFSLLPSLIGKAEAQKDNQRNGADADEDSDDEDSDALEDVEQDDEQDVDEQGDERPLLAPLRAMRPAGGSLRAAMTADGVRKLETALHELDECRKLLDAVLADKP